jgi:ABC-type amino acid transport system permease subunit
VLPEQWDFVGLHKEALLFIGMVFWVLAFYLSRISLRIEASMGLRHEGGGDLT